MCFLLSQISRIEIHRQPPLGLIPLQTLKITTSIVFCDSFPTQCLGVNINERKPKKLIRNTIVHSYPLPTVEPENCSLDIENRVLK